MNDSVQPLASALGPAASPPRGTLTFLFSDIEGSTRRWDRDRTAMQKAVRRHDALLRSAIESHSGHIFKTMGDAFCAVFALAPDAIAAALDAQRTIAGEDFGAVEGLAVRMALHSGNAEERDGDYFGPALNRVARLLSLGYGGQVLVSGAVAELMRDAMPARATLHDLGAHRLKDLALSEHVYQLTAPGLAGDFPELRSLDALPNNLPLQLTSFEGRDTEIAEIIALVAKHRLVTLTGAGGVGKTRVSLQVGANLLDGSADGVWFVELAPLSDPQLIPGTIAKALNLHLPSSGDPLPGLLALLQRKQLLIILDNCEHLVASVAAAASAILHACPKVSILASSRQALAIAGEAAFRMPSLNIPNAAETTTLRAQQACAYGAIALFVARAQSADARFVFTDEIAPIVVDICRRLDGIPLAIELAAARVKILKAHELRGRLDQRFRLLTGGSRDTLPRQQTLRALIDWSYDLLDECERTLFRRVGIFTDGFTLEGATAVASDETLDEFALFDVLASLVDKSLVVAETDRQITRYRLLESTRAYAAEKLQVAAEAAQLAARHFTYFYDLFARAGASYEDNPREATVLALSVELEDVRTALDWAAVNDPHRGAELLQATFLFPDLGLYREGIERAERFSALLDPADANLLGRLWTFITLCSQGCYDRTHSIDAAERAVAYARLSGNAATLADALSMFGRAAGLARRLSEAEAALHEAKSVAAPTARQRLQLLAAHGLLAVYQGDLHASTGAWEELRSLHRSLGNHRGEHAATSNLAELEHARGKTQRAIFLAREALTKAALVRDPNAEANTSANLTAYLVAVDDVAGARTAGNNVLRLYGKSDPTNYIVLGTLEHLGAACALAGDLKRAARLEGYVECAFRLNGQNREQTEATTHDRLMRLLRERLSAAELDSLIAAGAALTPEEAIAEGLA